MSPADLFSLTGKVAVVTGGSRGIGKAIAETLAAAGADVVIASRKLEACEVVAREIESTTGRRALAVRCHVGHWDDCSQLVSSTYDKFGACDVLVNNAGMSPLYENLTAITEDYYDKVHSVNLKGPFRLSALVGSRMVDSGGGPIINVGSVGSLRPGASNLVYACAKAGLNALTIGLAEAFGPSVRTNCILPGSVITDVASAWSAERRATVGEEFPLRRAGVPRDLAGAALWLASAASEWVTGTLVRVDGGSHMHL